VEGWVNEGLWTVTAGSAPMLYRSDIDKSNKKLASFFSHNGSGKTITDPITNIEIDAHHMIATMDGILTYSLVPDELADGEETCKRQLDSYSSKNSEKILRHCL
jgi:hypothetical protein